MKNITIRPSTKDELKTILEVELSAFGGDPEIETLVPDIFNDQTAQPLISLLAFENHCPIGHVYFSNTTIKKGDPRLKCLILAPLAVVPSHQKQGAGQVLIKEGLKIAKEQYNVDIVTVLGHPTYYPKAGFTPAYPYNITAPYPIAEKNKDAWMIQELTQGALEKARGAQIICCDALMKPEYWRE